MFRLLCRLWLIGPGANLLGLALMSMDHLIAVRWPLKQHIILNPKVVTVLIISAWTMAAILSIIYYNFIYKSMVYAIIDTFSTDAVTTNTVETFCRKWDDLMSKRRYSEEFAMYIFKCSIVGIVFITMFNIYCFIAYVAFKADKTKGHFQRHCAISTIKRNSLKGRLQKTKGITTTIMLLTAFLLLWVPSLILDVMIMTESPLLLDHDFIFGTVYCSLMVSCTTVVDVVIYFMRSREAVRLRKLLKFCKRSNNQSPCHMTSSSNELN